VGEFNEAHTFGVDLNGELGGKFFSLDGIKVEKQGTNQSSSQISLSGKTEKLLGQKLEIDFTAAEGSWTLKNNLGIELGKFVDFFEYEGLQINVSGAGAIGDSFEINFTEGLSENLTFQLENGRQIAASAFYLVERDPLNTSSTRVSISRFDEAEPGSVATLNSMFGTQRNSANPIDFLNNGSLGVLTEVDQLNDLTSIKTQSKLQFSENISALDSSSQLVIELDNLDRVFKLGNLASSVDNYQVLADYLNTGVIRSDDVDALSFADLGLFAGGNISTLSVTSASLPDYSSYPAMQSGTFGTSTGILIPAQPGNADIQIFTREGVQLAGRPLSQAEITSYISFENGFSRNAEYRSDYLTNDLSDTYIGASIVRKTTEGNHLASISSLGVSSTVDSNLDVAAMADFPVSRPIMSAPLTITNDVGTSYTFQSEAGMMAGNIAASLDTEISKLGLAVSASNRLEIFDIANGTLEFDLLGDNSSAVAISNTISGGETGSLVSQINDVSDITGIKAYTSGTGAIVLHKIDGNDIIIKNITTADASTFSTRQVDEFGEVVATEAQGIPVTVNTGNYIVSGGQIKITSPSELTVTSGENNLTSEKSEFISSFIDKQFDLENKKTVFKFDALSAVDLNTHDQSGLIGVAASSSYSFDLSSDIDNQSYSALVKPNSSDELTSDAVAGALVSELRKVSPQSNFIGNAFDFQNGFPADQSTIEFQLGEEQYFAVLNNKLSYSVDGDDVIIDGETFSQEDALKLIVNASSFTISGPEQDRLAVGFEAHGAGFRLFAVAKDGVVSGHGVRISDNVSEAQKTIFHLDHNSSGDTQTSIIGSEFSITQEAKANFAQVIAGNTTIDLSFDPDTTPKLTQSADIAGITVSLEETGNNNGRVVVTVDQSTANLDVGLKATNNSATFGILTSSSQLTLESGGFSVTNHNNERVTTSAIVESLANEVFSINGLDGEDLIVVAAGTGKISLLGEIKTKVNELDPRELKAKVSLNDSKQMEIFDMKSGDLLGSRKINDTNDFLFRDFKWELTGNAASNDIFNVRTTTERLDDASNLVQLMKLSELSTATGKGGYSQQYNDLVIDVGFNVRSSEQGLENAKVIYDVAADRKSSFSGVDLDTEAARLLEQQQAYQALAKVLSTAKEMVDTLLRSM
jgi:flagellar hook-associated protein 1 FlgK